jgi:hypothetical protein
MILSHLSIPQDLYSVIRASSYLRGAFTGSKEIIIRNVARNAFNSTALPEALVTVRFRQSDDSPNEDRDHHEQRLASILRLVREAARPPTLTLSESIELCRFFPSFNYFVQDYTRSFLENTQQKFGNRNQAMIAEKASSNKSHFGYSLSHLEMARVHRGFLRYSTLQSFMHTPRKSGYHDNRVTQQQAAAILAEFTPWEIEEIACVHQYFINRLQEIFNEVEDYFVGSVASTEQPSTSKYLPVGDNKNVDLQSMEAETQFFHEYEYSSGEEDVMFLDSEKGHQAPVIQHIATLGFPFLRNLCKADNARRNIMISENYYCKFVSLNDALRHCPRPQTDLFKREFQGRKSNQKLDFEGDHYQKRNLGWLWANQMQPHSGYYADYDVDLRSWGYVFWDSDRLEKLGVLKVPRPSGYCHSRPPHYKKLEVRPSAQRRLRELDWPKPIFMLRPSIKSTHVSP